MNTNAVLQRRRCATATLLALAQTLLALAQLNLD
jgi:hypothetical protein